MTKARPTVGDIPRDSVIAQMISWSELPPRVDAAVFGLPLDLPLESEVVVRLSGYVVEVIEPRERGLEMLRDSMIEDD